MAREIRGIAPDDNTLYARIMNRQGLWWNSSSFEAYVAANWANYDVALIQQGDSSVYVGDFPSAIQTGGTYEYFIHQQLGGSPAESDPIVNTGKVDWTGTDSISAASGSMSGSDFRDYIVQDKGFAREDKDQQIYAAITDAIQKLRRRFDFDEAKAEALTTDGIGTLGEFKIDIESDMGLLLDVTLEDGDFGTPLIKLSRAAFNDLYPGINVDGQRGYPKHYCVYGQQIQIGPIPDSIAYRYRLGYSRRAGAVTASTAGVPFTDLYRDVLAELVLMFLYSGLQEYDEADRHRVYFEDGFLEMTRRERRNAGEGSFNVRPTNF